MGQALIVERPQPPPSWSGVRPGFVGMRGQWSHDDAVQDLERPLHLELLENACTIDAEIGRDRGHAKMLLIPLSQTLV